MNLIEDRISSHRSIIASLLRNDSIQTYLLAFVAGFVLGLAIIFH